MQTQHNERLRAKGHVRLTLRNALTGEVEQVIEQDNLVVNTGLAALASIIWNPTADSQIRYVEIGTGTNAPAAGNTTLQTSYLRKTIASANSSAAIATITGYFIASEGNTTIREAGLFIGGTASAGTGTLFSRVALNVTKTSSQTLTIEWTITFAAV
jgi:hypothetical protein